MQFQEQHMHLSCIQMPALQLDFTAAAAVLKMHRGNTWWTAGAHSQIVTPFADSGSDAAAISSCQMQDCNELASYSQMPAELRRCYLS